MKKKVIVLTAVLLLLLTGVVSAASLWGTYKGNDIIRLTINGDPAQVGDVPAFSYDGRTMLPIYMLQQAGVNYSWDPKTKTVDIKKKPEQDVSNYNIDDTQARISKIVKDISSAADLRHYFIAADTNGWYVYATLFGKKNQDLSAQIYLVAMETLNLDLSRTGITGVSVEMYSDPNTFIGRAQISINDIKSMYQKNITYDQFLKKWTVEWVQQPVSSQQPSNQSTTQQNSPQQNNNQAACDAINNRYDNIIGDYLADLNRRGILDSSYAEQYKSLQNVERNQKLSAAGCPLK